MHEAIAPFGHMHRQPVGATMKMSTNQIARNGYVIQHVRQCLHLKNGVLDIAPECDFQTTDTATARTRQIYETTHYVRRNDYYNPIINDLLVHEAD
jgi:hypothetical protein